MANISGNAGSFRQNVFTRKTLQDAARHEERKDVTSRGDLDRGIPRRIVREVPPLVWRNGLIQVPPDWSADGNWDCGLEADYDAHVIDVRRHGKTGDSLCLHALIQFPKNMPVQDETDQRRMLEAAVAFVNRTHGGRAVFHARVDRDEDGQRTVDVFFVPTYAKGKRKGAESSAVEGQRWASLSKHQKSLAQAYKLPIDKVGRGRALQTAWFEYLRDEVNLRWAERGTPKKPGHDRVEPEIYKLRREREATDATLEDLKKEQAALDALKAEILERELQAARATEATRKALEQAQADLDARTNATEVSERELRSRQAEVLRQESAIGGHKADLDAREKVIDERETKHEHHEEAISLAVRLFADGRLHGVIELPDGSVRLNWTKGFQAATHDQIAGWQKILILARDAVIRLLRVLQQTYQGLSPEHQRLPPSEVMQKSDGYRRAPDRSEGL